MVEDSVDELIARLEVIRIQEDRLRDERRRVQERLRVARALEIGNAATAHPIPSASVAFARHDRVKILNPITHTRSGHRITEADYLGTVTRITAQRVFLKTDNGDEVCRAPKNLRNLSRSA